MLIDGIQGGNNEVHLNMRVAERGCCITALMQDSQCAFDSMHRCWISFRCGVEDFHDALTRCQVTF